MDLYKSQEPMALGPVPSTTDSTTKPTIPRLPPTQYECSGMTERPL